MDIKKEYERWLVNATADTDVADELKTLDDTKIEDAFYRDLAFGTGGLRGVIGAGTNRMNVYTVAKASQGLADYLKKNFTEPSVAIGYDSRIKSDVFAKVAAGVFAANGVKVNIWPTLMPVPTVSFATRYLHTSAGVMVTASHNPSKYNGYKVYAEDGAQVGPEAADGITAFIRSTPYTDCKLMDEEEAKAKGLLKIIGNKEVDDDYIAQVKTLCIQPELLAEEGSKLSIVYTPIHGSGNVPVRRILREVGISNVSVVKEQELPDPNFSTVKVPNLIGNEWSNAQVSLNIKGLKHQLAESDASQAGAVVTYQYPRAGAEVPYGTTVYLYTDTYEGRHTEVPDVTGKSADFARQMLAAAGLNCIVAGDANGLVQEQSEAAGASVQRGTLVTITCG